MNGLAAVASGEVYATGQTVSDQSVSNLDVFVRKYSAGGQLQWSRALDAGFRDLNRGAAVGPDGGVFVTGVTDGALGGISAGDSDAFVSRFDPDGIHLWSKQWGTDGADEVWGIAASSAGNVFVYGRTMGNLGGPNAGYLDLFLTSFGSDGTPRWTRQFGGAGDDQIGGVTTDLAGNVYVGAELLDRDADSFGKGTEASVAKYSPHGDLIWRRPILGPGAEHVYDVSVNDAGELFALGVSTDGLDAPGLYGASFLRKFDANGEVAWTRLFSGALALTATHLDIDALGTVYVAGTHPHRLNMFARTYDAEGNLLWDKTFNSPHIELTRGVSVDDVGGVYLSATQLVTTDSAVASQEAQLLLKLTPVPEPRSGQLLCSCVAWLACCVGRSRPLA